MRVRDRKEIEINGPNILHQVLRSRGITDIGSYLNPSKSLLQDWKDLDNIDEAARFLIKILGEEDPRLLLVVDADQDGFNSSAILYQYLKGVRKDLRIEWILHEGKAHGLGDLVSRIKDCAPYRLVILPDSGSNDKEFYELFPDTSFICLDHHLQTEEVPENCILVNNQSSARYRNKTLCGSGVTYQFCRALDSYLNRNDADMYLDLVAWATVADVMDMTELENRYLVKSGFEQIRNYFLSTLIDKQSYSMGNRVNPMTVAFYIVPLVNAMIRVGTMEEKERLFVAFINGHKAVPSGKRGAGGTLEEVAIESARECGNARTRQNRIKDEMTAILDRRIQEEGLLNNRILLIRLREFDDFPASLTGLVAMQLGSKYCRPCIVAKLDSEGFISGSARGLNNSELVDFRQFLLESKLFEYVAGHPGAAGLKIQNNRLSDFHSYANKGLEGIDFGEGIYEVDLVIDPDSKDVGRLIFDLCSDPDMWAPTCPAPLLYVPDIPISRERVKIVGKSSDTIQFFNNGITYLKFKASGLRDDLIYHDYSGTLSIIGRPNLNIWNGRTIPQIMIEDFEIGEVDDLNPIEEFGTEVGKNFWDF